MRKINSITETRKRKIEENFGGNIKELALYLERLARFEKHLGSEAVAFLVDDGKDESNRKLILRYPPTKKRPYYTLMTAGLADGLELMLLAKEPSTWMFEALCKAMAMSQAMKMALKSGGLLNVEMSGEDATCDPSRRLYVIQPVEAKGLTQSAFEGRRIEVLQTVVISESEWLNVKKMGEDAVWELLRKKKIFPLVGSGRESLINDGSGRRPTAAKTLEG